MVILAILPLGHFLAGILSLALPRSRGRRALLVLSLMVDAVLISILYREIVVMGNVRIVLGGWDRAVGIELSADWVSLSFCGLFLGLAFSVTAYLWKEELQAYFFLLLHLLFGSVLGLLFSRDLFNIYVVLELLSLVSFLLIGYERKPEQFWTGLKYLFFATFGMGMYLFGVGVVYAHVGTLNLSMIAVRLPADLPPWGVLAAALLVTGVAVKAGVFIFSLWLPGTYSSSHPAVSALFAGLVSKMGFVVLLRLFSVFPIRGALFVLGAITGILGVAYMIATYDLKRMLAFSSLSQMGYLLLGLGTGAIGGAVAYAVAHGLFKGLLFLAGGEAVRTAEVRDIPGLVGRKIPVQSRLGLLIGTLAIMGLPPFAGFAGKAILYGESEGIPFQVIMGIISLGTVISFSKLVPVFRFVDIGEVVGEKALSYAIVAIPVLFFLPMMWAFVPRGLWRHLLNPIVISESLFIVGIGFILYRLISRYPLHLPERIFRLEEGVLVILSGFFLVFFLVWIAG